MCYISCIMVVLYYVSALVYFCLGLRDVPAEEPGRNNSDVNNE